MNDDNKPQGIMMFENQFEYLTEGIMNEKQWYEYCMMIAYCRFEGRDYKEEKDLDPLVRAVWKQTKPSVLKSKRNAKYHKTKKEIVDNETGEIVEQKQEENIKTEETKEMTINGEWVDVPTNIKEMVCDNTVRLSQMFGLFPTDSDETKEALQEEFESMCSIYNVEPSNSNKRMVMDILNELQRRNDERRQKEEEQQPTYTLSIEIKKPEEKKVELKEEALNLIKEFPYRIPYQAFDTFYRSNPSTCNNWLSTGLTYDEVKVAFEKVLSERKIEEEREY